MANNDLNFNLEDFLASHANDAKQVQVPKKRRSGTKSSSKTKKSTPAKETPNPTEIVEPIKPAEPTEAEQATPSVEEQTEIISDISEEIISEQITVDTSADLNQADTVAEETAQDIPTQDLQSQQSLIEDNQDIAQEITEAETEEEIRETVVEAVTESVVEAQKPKDDVWARLEEKFGKLSDDSIENTPAQVLEEPVQSQSALPRYKENTTEIGFSQRRLSDTATVGVRRINRSELSPNETVIGESKHTPTSEELELQERLRRDREITEKILRRAYAQEEQSAEIAADNPQSSSEGAETAEQKSKASATVQIGGRYKQKTKQKKGKKQKQKEQERTLPVLQVGTTDEDDSQSSIMDMLENALDEDIIELEYVSKNNEESPKYETAPEKKKNKAQTVYFLIGLFFTVMSIIGIVVSAKSAVKFVKNFSDDSKQKQEFAEYIYPVVITDPAAFESVNDLSDEAIIKSSLWDIIMYDDGAKYETDASGNMYVPYIQVENHAKALFGTTNIVHSTVAFSQELTFFYDFETRMYKVPISPQIFPNTPVVKEIEKAGERYTLTVDYQEPTPNWALMDDEYEPGIIKTMEYVLTKYNDGYTIISISSVE